MSDDAVKAARDAAAHTTNTGANLQEVARIRAQAHADIDAAEAAAIAPQTDRAVEIPAAARAEIVAGQDTPDARTALADALSRKQTLRAELRALEGG